MIYRNFAQIYDELMDHAPYDEWTSFALQSIEKFGKNIKTIIDLGCGTGEITTRLAKYGLNMYGIDNSNEMLAIAMEKSFEQNVSVHWINQDIRKLQGFQELDMAISFCDVFNYIHSEEDLLQSFQHIYSSLREDGLLLFDLHSYDYAKSELLNQSFSSREDDVAYIWDCEAGSKEGELIHHLSFFVNTEDHVYERFDETHVQRVFPLNTYERLLKDAQFTILNFYRDFSFDLPFSSEKAERIFILAQKRAK